MKVIKNIYKIYSNLSFKSKIINADLPRYVEIPMYQNIGLPAIPIVKKGDKVEEGELIGKASGIISSNVHSSIKGEVIDIYESKTFNNIKTKFIKIKFIAKLSGIIGKSVYNNKDWDLLENEEILDQIYKAGIVDFSEYVIPLYAKLKVAIKQSTTKLIINGLFPEIYLNASWVLIENYSSKIIEGIEILKKLLNIKLVIVVLSKENSFLETNIKKLFKKNDIEIQTIKSKNIYTEKLLAEKVAGIKIPESLLPCHKEIFICNINTIYNIYNAMVLKKPMTKKIITITGKEVKKKAYYEVRLGTPIKYLLEECGFKLNEVDIIIGNYMRGIYSKNLSQSITKDIHSINVIPKTKITKQKEIACIRCGECINVCPVSIVPVQLYELIEQKKWSELKQANINKCIECGHCSYICPSSISLMERFISVKQNIKKEKEIMDL